MLRFIYRSTYYVIPHCRQDLGATADSLTAPHLCALTDNSMQAKQRFNEIAEELTKLSTNFSNNVLDSTKAFSKLLTTQEEVDGLPASALALMAQQAKGKGNEGATAENGPWLVTLDIPSYLPVQVRPPQYITFAGHCTGEMSGCSTQ